MTILSTVCTKLLCTNAHLGRRVAAHHLKVYTRGSRNGIAILDSDKILICLRSALHFIGSLIRKKGHSFFLKTNHLFILLIMEKMIYLIMEKMGSCIKDSQWKIGAFLTNSYANPKKFRSRKKKIHFGLNQQPDCVVIPKTDRKSSVILEANRLQIPIASLLDSTFPWESYKRITYPIPANDTIQFIYLFRHSITKTVIRERQMQGARALHKGKLLGQRQRTYSNYSQRKKKHFFFFLMKIRLLLSWFPLGLLCYFSRVPTSILSLIISIFFFILSILFGVDSAAAASNSDIVIAHQPGSSGYNTSDFLDHILETETSSASSGEPSVNQPTPELLPVQQEVERQALLTEIHEVIKQEYQRYIVRSMHLMKYSGFLHSQSIDTQVQFIIEEIELDRSSVEDLRQFLQDFWANPRQLNSFFKIYWGK